MCRKDTHNGPTSTPRLAAGRARELEPCSWYCAVADTLGRLLATYEPGASYAPLADSAFYGPRLRRLATMQLRVVHSHAKFKVGPAGPDAMKQQVARRLRERGETGDERAAEVIESYL